MTATAVAAVLEPAAPRRSRARLNWSRRHLVLVPVAVIVLIAIFGKYVLPYDPTRVVANPDLSPDGKYWFGTDSNGMDVFSRTIAATEVNVLIGSLIAVFATLIGLALGLMIGMNESRRGPLGLLARGAARVVDLLQAVPALVIALVGVSFYGATTASIVATLAFTLAPVQTRLVRTEVLRVRSEAYLDAARLAGQSEIRLTVRHVLPNSCRPALANAAVIFSLGIVLTAALGFVGVGIPPPAPEWGSMLSSGVSDALVGRWWPALFPALALSLTVATVAGLTTFLFRTRRA